MKKIIYLLVGFTLSIQFSECKSDSKGDSSSSTNQNTGKAEVNGDPLMIQLPEGCYKPKGLKQINIMEMYKFGSENPLAVRNLPLKDKNGNDVPSRYMDNPEKPMFMQMFVNDSGRVVEGVVLELNEEMKGLIMRVRMAKPN